MQPTVSIMVTAALLGGALAACSGGTTSTTTTAPASPAATTKMKPAKSMGSLASAGNGAAVFAKNCSSCHQATGKGVTGTFPPLAGNAAVTGDPKKVIHIVKDGLAGKIVVSGTSYNGQMPAWKGTLSNADIAAVVTYIRSAWGNHAGPVTAAQVAKTP